MMRRPILIEAVSELGLVPAGTPVLADVSRPEDVEEHERGGIELSVQETVDRFQGLFWARVEDLAAPSEPADIITTRHESLIE
jgi:hypothetical protein